jgi:signal transduction histidine kinase
MGSIMPARNQSLVSPRIHDSVVRTGAAVSWLAALYLAISGLLGHDPRLLAGTLGTVAIATVLTAMAATGHEIGAPTVMAAAATLIVQQRLAGTDTTEIPALVMLVAIGVTIVVLFRYRHRVVALAGWSIAVFVAPAWWEGFSRHGYALGISSLVSFCLVAPIAVTVRRTLLTSERRYQSLFESLPMAVLEQDWQGVRQELQLLRNHGVADLGEYLEAHPSEVARIISTVQIVDANPAAVSMLNARSQSEVIGPLRATRVNQQNWRHFADQLIAVWEEQPVFSNIFRIEAYDGDEKWVQMRWIDTAIQGTGNSRSVILAAADVTNARRATERATRLANLRGRLIDAVGHELRTPLSVVVGLADQLAGSRLDHDPAELDGLLAMLREEAESVATIVDNLITASLMETGELRLRCNEFDLMEVVAGTLAGLEPRIGAAVSLPVSADQERTEQIARCIAMSFTHYGGLHPEIGAGYNGELAWVSIAGTGSPLAATGIERAFDNDDDFEHGALTTGFGLSLGVARRLAYRMDGRLELVRHDDGTEFRLELPAAASTQVTAIGTSDETRAMTAS